MEPHAAPAAAMAHLAVRGDRGAYVDPVLMAHLVNDGGELAAGVPALGVAAHFGNVPIIQALLAAGAAANARYDRAPFSGWTALHFAAVAGDAVAVSTVAALVAAGAHADARSAAGLLPVDVSGSAAVTAELQKAGSPPCGAPSLYDSSQAGVFLRMMAAVAALRPSEAAEALLSSSRPRDMMRWADPSGRTALHLAAFAGSPQLCEWCLDNGADVDARDFTGATPLRDTLAGYLPAPPVVKVLLDHGATAVEEDVRLAVKFGMPSVVGMLLAAGAPALPNVPTSLAAKVNTARLQLGGPLYTQRAFLIESLFRHNALAFGAAVRTGAHDPTYALAAAACFGSPAQLQVLLDLGVDVNARLEGASAPWIGATALHCAAACGVEPRTESIRKLLEAGAEVDVELPCGLRPLDVARHHSVRTLLRAKGGRKLGTRPQKSARAPRRARSWLC